MDIRPVLMTQAQFRFPGRHTSGSCVAVLGVALAIGVWHSFALSQEAAEAEPPETPQVEYNRDVLPILAEHCFACHGQDSESREAGLRLDVRQEAIDFGAIVPGDLESSELVFRIDSDDQSMVMPPPHTDRPLSEADKQVLREWIASGAEYQTHWSFVAPERVEPPRVSDSGWVKNPIDNFILSSLESEGLQPAPSANLHTLIRRLHLDITGLPPTSQVVDDFIADVSSEGDIAVSRWIDRLMDSPQWGEHRARYWLDAARYGDTHGLHFDNYREIYPYRDWVIQAFNENKSFDEFTIEQLAGDLLPDPTLDQLVATGFQRCNITTNEGGTIDEENLALYAADRVQTFGWVFLGLTTNCSQCHDHKFDPITAKDYYSLAAFFRNTTQKAKDGNKDDGLGPVTVVPSLEDRPRWQALPDEIAIAKRAVEQRRANASDEFEHWLGEVSEAAFDAKIPSEGLQLHALLNEGSGNQLTNLAAEQETFDSSGEVKWQPGGKLGSALEITAESTFELAEYGDFGANDSFSYGAWVKPANDSSSGGIVARMNEEADHRGWDLWQQGGSFAVHIIDTWPGNALKVATESPAVKPGEWQHVLVTYDGSRKPEGIHIYVDGKPQGLKTETNSLDDQADIHTDVPFRIGGRSHSALFLGGALQDVRIYNRQLSAAEVETLATHGPLKSILAESPEERTEEQRNALFEYFLNSIDEAYTARQHKLHSLQQEQAEIRQRSPITHIQQEREDSPAMAHILERGEYDSPGEEVLAAPPAALHPMPEGATADRLGLAKWTVDPANPLTSRVTVNRYWQQVFGQGIVVTPEDFGIMGADPSHPELLDWLAVEFRESGWDVKHIFKLMFSSATYQQAAQTTPMKLERDRSNALLSRGPRFRMDAEMIRDYALAVSGLLSDTMGGPGVKPYQPIGIWDVVGLPGGNTREYERSDGENLYRRSVYNFWKRMAPPPNLETLNAPSREVCTVQRERTNTPLQALVTLNDSQFVEAARALAQRELLKVDGGDDAVLQSMAKRVLSRSLGEQERNIMISSLNEYRDYYGQQPDAAQQLVEVGELPVAEQLEVSEFASWTLLANQLLNLDEVLCK